MPEHSEATFAESGSAKGRWQSYLSGPRGAFGVETIYDIAAGAGLQVESVEEHKGWFNKTITFTLTGERRRIAAAQRVVARAIRRWNGD